MPTDHGFGPNHHESALPVAPKSREKDPEGSIERREPRPRMAVNVDGQLLAKCQLYDGLVLLTSE
jgi:hypothetical protein